LGIVWNPLLNKTGRSAAVAINTGEVIGLIAGKKIKIRNEPGICKRRR
jgi:hypothetical protein